MDKIETMKLELKHLTCYLPYGLQINQHREDININWQSELVSLSADQLKVMSRKFPYIENLAYYEAKPILRPLSDLTKEIEVDGEKFVPMTIISGMEDFEHYFEYLDMFKPDSMLKFEMINVFWKNTEFNTKQKAFTKFQLWRFSDIRFDHAQLLFEWHFDVFGLIKEGLAISINTLKP